MACRHPFCRLYLLQYHQTQGIYHQVFFSCFYALSSLPCLLILDLPSFHRDNYFGEKIDIDEAGVIRKNILMQKKGFRMTDVIFHWNILAHLYSIIFWAGLVCNLVILIFFPSLANKILVLFYVLVVATPLVKVIVAGEPKSTSALFLSFTLGTVPSGEALAPEKVRAWSPV